MVLFNKKITTKQMLRFLFQIISFILLPGLFITIFSSIRNVYESILQGSFSLSTLSYQLWVLIAIIPITILMGRFFCGYLCAFGSLGDFYWFLARKINPNPRKISERADRVLKLFKYIFLVFLVVFIWTLGVFTFDSNTNPWAIFGMIFSFSRWPLTTYLFTIGGALLLMITIGSLFVERFFCRYLCPLGAFFSIISRMRLFIIKKPRKSCGNCTICTSQCKMGIPLYQHDFVSTGECINCFACVDACPNKNVTATPVPSVAAAMATAAISGIYYVGTISEESSTTNLLQTTIADTFLSSGQYTDGVYMGSAFGYRGTTEVQVTVENGNITNIEILSTDDDMEYFNQIESSIINRILLSQSTDVDTVTGATFSCNAISNAVTDALDLTYENTNSSTAMGDHHRGG